MTTAGSAPRSPTLWTSGDWNAFFGFGTNILVNMLAASAFAAAGAVLTFFGFMHGEFVGIAVTPSVAVAYAIVAGLLFALARQPETSLAATPKEPMATAPAE